MVDIRNKEDYLLLKNTPEILDIIRDETLLFSDTIDKMNSYGWKQSRNIIITDKAIYNFKRLNFKRKLQFTSVSGISIKSSHDEFIIHSEGIEHDFYLFSPKIKRIIEIIYKRLQLVNKDIIFCEINNKTLDVYVTTRKEKKKNPQLSKLDITMAKDIKMYLENNDSTQTERDNSLFQSIGTIFMRNNTIKKTTITDFEQKIVLSKSTGKIYLAEHKPSREIYAMKCYKKHELIEQKLIECAKTEKQILESISHAFLMNASFCSMQTDERIYYIMPYYAGGDLFTLLSKEKSFDEITAKFYAAQIALVIGYLHKNKIIHRGINPENMLLDNQGYLKLTDFGHSIICQKTNPVMENNFEYAYIAPEILKKENYNYSVDWWSFGIFIYEMLFGQVPFDGDDDEEIKKAIETAPIKFPTNYGISDEAKDIILQLLEKNPSKRLGNQNGLKDIKAHPFFLSTDFDSILNYKDPVPFVPKIKSILDVHNFDQDITALNPIETLITKNKLLLNEENKDDFIGL